MKKIKFIIGILALSLFLPQGAFADLNADGVHKIINGVGDYMLANQNRAGDFVYEYWPFLDEKANDNNEVRQLAATITLSTIYELTKNEKILEALVKTADHWLETSQISTVDHKTIRYFAGPKGAQLGSAAVFYYGISLLHTEAPTWWHKNSGRIAEIENFLLWMKKTKNGFAGTYQKGMTTPAKNLAKNSGYFDGEAMLALARWDLIHNTPESKQVVFDIYRDLEETYRAVNGQGLYLWLMKASRELYSKYPDPLFSDFAKKYHDRFIRMIKLPRTDMANNCADLEGVNAYRLLRQEATGKDDEKLAAIAQAEMNRLSRLQITAKSRYRVALGRAFQAFPPNEKGLGGFLTSLKAPRQRIDFQQHCVSAFRDYLYFLENH